MQHLKVSAYGLVAAIVLMALGVGTASATRICMPTGAGDGKCPTSNEKKYSVGDSITYTSTNPNTTTSITSITCKESSMTVKFNAAEGASISGEVTAFSLSNDCTTSGGTSCTVTVVNLPYPASLTSSEFTVNDAAGAGFKVVCGVLINCTFTSTDTVTAVNHDSYTVTHPTNRTGGFCPETAEFHATYTITSPAGTTVL